MRKELARSGMSSRISLIAPVPPGPSLPQESLQDLTALIQAAPLTDEWETVKVELLNNGSTTVKIEKNKITGATRTTTRVDDASVTVEIDNGDGTGITTIGEVAGGMLRATVRKKGRGIIETTTMEVTGGLITKTTYTRQVENHKGEWSSVTDAFQWGPVVLPNGVRFSTPVRRRPYGTLWRLRLGRNANRWIQRHKHAFAATDTDRFFRALCWSFAA
jgi:hypothetical protein